MQNIGRRGIRRREGVHDKEVAEAVCDLVGCVRLEHVLPLGGEESVRQAAARGILTRSWAPGGFGQNTARGQEFGTQHWDPRIFRWVRSSLFIRQQGDIIASFQTLEHKTKTVSAVLRGL